MAATSINFADDCATALADVRSDASDTNWAAFTYAADSVTDAVVHATGSGNADELAEHLADDLFVYALLRTTLQVDDSTTVKFVLVRWSGAKASAKLRGRQTVHSGAWKAFIGQVHVAIDADGDRSEVTQDVVDKAVATAAGVKSHVLDETVDTGVGFGRKTPPPTSDGGDAAAAAPVDKNKISSMGAFKTGVSADERMAKQKKATQAVPKTLKNVSVADLEAIQGAINAVRSDAAEENWVLLAYVPDAKPDTLHLVGTGAGGINDMIAQLTDDNVYYGLSRHIDQIDDSTTIKFAFTHFVGQKAKRMLRARMSTHKGALEELIGATQVTHFCEAIDEITEDIINDKIGSASGSKSHVL